MLVQEQRETHKLTLFDFQKEIFNDKSRYKIVAAGRRVGKSYLSCVSGLHHCLSKPDQRVLIVGPTYGQTKEAVWSNLKSIIHSSWVSKISESDLEVLFINGSKISLKGSDRPETLRGISPSPTFIITDEFSFFKTGTFQEVLLPMAVDPQRKASFLIISTPKGVGNEFHELWLRGQSKNTKYNDWKSWQFTCVNARPDMREEVELARESMDAKTFDQEYQASFTNTGYSVFYPFKYNVHVTKDLPFFERGETVHLAVDFNVAVMAASAFALRGNQIHWLKDYSGDANTEELCKRVNRDFPNHQIKAYPDPSGKARKSSAAIGQTDFSIMQENNWTLQVHSSAPPIVDSVNCVNRLLEDANGNTNMFFHENCKDLIKSMSGTQWKQTSTGGGLDTPTIDKSSGIEHWTDGLRYAVHYLFPIKSNQRRIVRSSRF